ncbi:hypothetical protein IJ579_05030 [bacterium]|nr:hypothetical protein [bacterium]
MTNFLTQTVCGPVLSPVVAKDKGDVSNRAKCAGSQFKNNLSTLAQDTVVIGAGAGTLKAAKEMPRLRRFFVRTFDKIVKWNAPIRKRFVELTGEYGTKFSTFELTRGAKAEKLLKLPGMAKVAALVALPVIAGISYIGTKHIYKMGQIDQKYTDKAKLEQHNKEIV